jgi:hypothetical protein
MDRCQHDDVCDEIVIHYPWLDQALMLCLGAAPLIALSVVGWHRSLSIIGALLLLGQAIASPRRKLVITHDVITYRPAIGSPRRAKFDETISVRQGFVRTPSGKVVVPGPILSMKNGIVVEIPLDFPNHEEVFSRLLNAFQDYVDVHGRVNRDLKPPEIH